ncbi:hypothetical protein HYR99_18800 [Candidatus Poribacteria bacterium]|nr:hypothetical protein [Candidatus Poribacteria bacterium]
MASKEELKATLGGPIHLAPNTYLHFYNGGKLRAAFMGEADPKDDFRSEEWIFSTNRAITPGRENPPDKGFSRIQLPSGEVVLLKELLDVFPNETLGKAHVDKLGTNLGVLLKIFDVGDGAHIPIHWHPEPEFSKKYLNSPFGKNEAWIVIGTRPGARAWIGWKEDLPKAEFRKLMDAQDIETLRGLMHVVEPKVGDVIFLRTRFVHSLGSGLCILEPQEPTDWNILAEWKGFPYGREDGTLGLGWDLALEAADFSKMGLDYLNGYVKRTPETIRSENGSREDRLVPDEASQFFQVSRLTIGSKLSMPAGRGFYCLVTLQGEGVLRGPFRDAPIQRGKSVFIPTCLPDYEMVNTGETPMEVICCYPPVVG